MSERFLIGILFGIIVSEKLKIFSYNLQWPRGNGFHFDPYRSEISEHALLE